MKFLLAAVNAKYIHSNPAVYSLKAYAGAECEKEIEIAEYTINNSMAYICPIFIGASRMRLHFPAIYGIGGSCGN